MKRFGYPLPFLLVVFTLFIMQNINQVNTKLHDTNLIFESGLTSQLNSEIGLIDQNETRQNTEANITSQGLFALSPINPNNMRQWSLNTMQVPDQKQLESLKTQEVLVAILDTGIDRDHEDIQNVVKIEIDLTGESSPDDIKGHGTHVAGIIAANSSNQIGITGLAPNAKLINVKVADNNGRSQADIVARGVLWAVENGAKVINISIEFDEGYIDLEKAINYANQKGCLVIAAASNHTIQPVFPSFYENCLAVVATDEQDCLGSLAYNADWIDIAAPGFSIYSTLPNNNYGYKSGTSFATAQVSGLATILFGLAIDQNNDGRLNDEVRESIIKGARISSDGIKRVDFMDSIILINSGN
jgi:thermitase